MGHRSILDMASAYGAKGPGFTTRWRQQFINLKMYVQFFAFDWNKATIGANLKKNKIPVLVKLPHNCFPSCNLIGVGSIDLVNLVTFSPESPSDSESVSHVLDRPTLIKMDWHNPISNFSPVFTCMVGHLPAQHDIKLQFKPSPPPPTTWDNILINISYTHQLSTAY